jgi:hypothetical protein
MDRLNGDHLCLVWRKSLDLLAQVFAWSECKVYGSSQRRSLVPFMLQVSGLANYEVRQSGDCRHGRAQVIAGKIV